MSNQSRHIVVIGNAGVGKSYFINKYAKENVNSGDGPHHVTKKTSDFVSVDDPSLFFVDTVGLDIDSVPLESLKGKMVCIVAIVSSARAFDEKRRILEKFGKWPCVFYCCYNYQQSLPEGFLSITDFCFDQLPGFECFHSLSVDDPIKRLIQQRQQIQQQQQQIQQRQQIQQQQQNTKKQKQKQTKQQQLSQLIFRKTNLGQLEVQLLSLYESGFLRPCKQVEVDLKLLETHGELLMYRARGESILKYVLQCLNMYDAAAVECMMSNERLGGFVREWELEGHFRGLFGNSDDPGQEKRADYIEALFGFVFEHKKRMLVSLVKKIAS